jgi:hypothetical protein
MILCEKLNCIMHMTQSKGEGREGEEGRRGVRGGRGGEEIEGEGERLDKVYYEGNLSCLFLYFLVEFNI